MNKNTYLITGGAGFIGSHIVRHVLDRGEAVRVFDNFSTGRRDNLAGLENDIELVEGDLRDLEAVRAAAKGVRYVLHLGALGSVQRSVDDPLTTHDVNITGTLNALLAARDAGVERFVFSSSSSVYGNTPTLPKHEAMPPMPLSPYALSKLTGEHYARLFRQLYGLRAYSLRYFNVFGPRQDPHSQYAAVIPLFVSAYRERRPPVIHGDGEQTRDFTFVENVAQANLACCSAPDEAAGEAFNIGFGGRLSVNRLAEAIAEALGSDLRPEHDEPRPGDVRDSQASVEKAERLLGWKPTVSFEEGLRRTVAWQP